MDYEFISRYDKLVTSQTASFSRADINRSITAPSDSDTPPNGSVTPPNDSVTPPRGRSQMTSSS